MAPHAFSPARRRLLARGFALAATAGLGALGVSLGREARAQTKPAVKVHKSPT